MVGGTGACGAALGPRDACTFPDQELDTFAGLELVNLCSQYLRERCDHSRPEENDYPANLRRTQIRQPSNPKRYDAPNHMEARRLALEDFQRRGRRRAVQRAASAGLQDTPGKPRQRTDSHAPQSAGASRAAPTKRAVS